MVATMMMRVAVHLPAALHGLLRRGHAKTVDSIRRHCEGQRSRWHTFDVFGKARFRHINDFNLRRMTKIHESIDCRVGGGL
jgi:hypothetical protein